MTDDLVVREDEAQKLAGRAKFWADEDDWLHNQVGNLARAYLAVVAERDKAIRRQEHTEHWYAVRLEPIKDVAKREGIWPEIAAIIANGSGTRQLPDGTYTYDPPTYAQQLNIAEGRAKAAEAQLAAMTAERDAAREQSDMWSLRFKDEADKADMLQAQLAAMTAERDALGERVGLSNFLIDGLKAQLKAGQG
jgi:hypothetical protein